MWARTRVTRNAARVLVGTAFVNCSVGRLSRRNNQICVDLEEGSDWLRTGYSGGRLTLLTWRIW
jgi:hypothetical protein